MLTVGLDLLTVGWRPSTRGSATFTPMTAVFYSTAERSWRVGLQALELGV